MYIPTLGKVIDLYLRGLGYHEISMCSGITRPTVQDNVNRWKKG